MKNHNFNVSVTVDEHTGEVISVYFEVRKGRSAQTTEHGDGVAFADYDKHGVLLGIEVLAPCRLQVLNRIKGVEPEVRKFVKSAAPRALVMA
jgi:uncharacterized protein YuzE